jgi:mannose-6-phosphate isomerase-like protein (cupin superfamily)
MEIIEKPWGREKIVELNDKYCMKILEINAGKRLSLQYHKIKRETMYCLYGIGELEVYALDGAQKVFSMLPGRFFTISPGQVHRIIAGKHSNLVVMEASTPEMDDVIRVQDDYGRTED